MEKMENVIQDEEGKGTSSSKFGFFIKTSTHGILSKSSMTSQDGKGTFATEDQQTYGTFHSEGNRTTVSVDAIEEGTDFTLSNPSGSVIVGDIKGAGDLEFVATSNLNTGNISTDGSVSMICVSEDVDPVFSDFAMSFFK